jgi:hypothetical protein
MLALFEQAGMQLGLNFVFHGFSPFGEKGNTLLYFLVRQAVRWYEGVLSKKNFIKTTRNKSI